MFKFCPLYKSDAADDHTCVGVGRHRNMQHHTPSIQLGRRANNRN